ncbi:unnamed protein product [Oppiella nova]|uniref:Uncharacterized protein n=1 Tax=Oppiella nova TaxID=334625 RepID=A0A7R9QL20_9ACAR|nr:unnamed protein product [Oppiella nova]CAG2168107.1 unnamed protein product [Oppiella nova]
MANIIKEQGLGGVKPHTPIPFILRLPYLGWRFIKDAGADIKIIANSAINARHYGIQLAEDLPVINDINISGGGAHITNHFGVMAVENHEGCQ